MSSFQSTNHLQNYILNLSLKISKVPPQILNANKVTENILTCSSCSIQHNEARIRLFLKSCSQVLIWLTLNLTPPTTNQSPVNLYSTRLMQWQPTPVLLPVNSHERRSLVGCSPWGRKELDRTDRLHFHFHALEKEMATHSSVLAWRTPGTGEPGGLPSMGSQSRTRLKRLSSSSSRLMQRWAWQRTEMVWT